jgi:hypothetical protein
MAQGEGPEFMPLYHRIKKRSKKAFLTCGMQNSCLLQVKVTNRRRKCNRHAIVYSLDQNGNWKSWTVHSFSFLQYWGLNSGLSPWETPSTQFFVIEVFEIGSHELFSQASFELRSFWSLCPDQLILQVWTTSAQPRFCILESMLAASAKKLKLKSFGIYMLSCSYSEVFYWKLETLYIQESHKAARNISLLCTWV